LPATSDQRYALVASNRDAIASILQRKCERGEWHDEDRFGSTVKRVDSYLVATTTYRSSTFSISV
jgi:hypothetical protein